MQLLQGCGLSVVSPAPVGMDEPLLMGSPGQGWLQPPSLLLGGAQLLHCHGLGDNAKIWEIVLCELLCPLELTAK